MKISGISVYLLKGHIQNYIFCEIPLGGFEVGNNIALKVTVCIALFKTISKRNIVSITSQCLAGINVNGETEHAQTVCTRFFFSAHARTRTWEQGYVQQHMHPLIPYLMYTGNRTGSTVCRLIVFSLHTCME